LVPSFTGHGVEAIHEYLSVERLVPSPSLDPIRGSCGFHQVSNPGFGKLSDSKMALSKSTSASVETAPSIGLGTVDDVDGCSDTIDAFDTLVGSNTEENIIHIAIITRMRNEARW